ncbi:hypothetical protein BJX96DRAFT_187521 [Aspergillus floccosus]
MRLRDSVRPPERYKADEFYAPFTPKSARERSSQPVPTYVDYNQNLPPAAFPTLDRPRATESYASRFSEGKNGNGNATRGDNRGTPEDNNIKGMLTDHLNTNVASHRVGHVGHPTHIDNTISGLRGGPGQLPTPMGNNDHDNRGGLSFHDYMMEPEDSYYDLDWSHLSPQLQVEIFSNLLQHHEGPTVCRMLGMIDQEEQLIKEALESRKAQVSLEDYYMKHMRQTQLNALLRRDNSVEHKEMHEELLFRKVSRQSTRGLIGRPEIDYFSCRESDLAKAELFIQRRALDPWVIGEWSNGIFTSTSSSASKPTGDNVASIVMNKCRLTMKSVDATSGFNSHDPQLCMGYSRAVPRGQALHQSLHNHREGSQQIVQLKVGAQRAAQIQDFEQARDEPNLIHVEFPEIEYHHWRRPWEIPARTSEPYGSAASIFPSSTAENTSVSLWTMLGSNRSCNSAEPRLEPLSSSVRLRERLEEQVHLEAQRQREQAPGARIFGIQSPPAPPAILMSEDGFYELYTSDNDSYSVISINTLGQRSYSTDVSCEVSDEMSSRSSAYRPLTPPMSAIRPSFTPPTPASECNYEAYVQDEGDCEYEEDEMDLVRQIGEDRQPNA